MRHPAANHTRPAWALLCLLAYLCSATPLLPGGTALVAWLDGEHHVSLAVEKDGTRVVLGHDAHNPRTALTHSHCAVSRMLTLLAEPSGPLHSDHVLSFSCAGVAILREAAVRIAAPLVDETLTAPTSAAPAVLPKLVANAEAPLLDIPPPAMSVLVIRTTVLVI